jgi:hypothetical protein
LLPPWVIRIRRCQCLAHSLLNEFIADSVACLFAPFPDHGFHFLLEKVISFFSLYLFLYCTVLLRLITSKSSVGVMRMSKSIKALKIWIYRHVGHSHAAISDGITLHWTPPSIFVKFMLVTSPKFKDGFSSRYFCWRWRNSFAELKIDVWSEVKSDLME